MNRDSSQRIIGRRDTRTREVRDYTKIEAWRYSDDLTVAAYEITRRFPREEIYGLTSQLRRASYSEVQRQVKATLSRSHALTLSRSHALTLSRSHALTLSRSHALTLFPPP
jgi:hypothetical protein